MNTLKFQQRVLGVLCSLLAPCSILFGLFGNNLPYWYKSISATYYANSNICLIGLLFATSVFFFCYNGYETIDKIFSYIQAISGMGIIVFPCLTDGVTGKVGLFGIQVNISHIIHCICAGILFLTFATNIVFLFTKGDKTNPDKRKRNIVYYVCGITIYVSFILDVLTFIVLLPYWFPAVTILEFIMLESYALSWLTKSGMFKRLNDNS